MPAKAIAQLLGNEVVPYVESIEIYALGMGLKREEFSSYTRLKNWFAGAADILEGDPGPVVDETLEECYVKLDSLQECLPVILRKMPESFTLHWSVISSDFDRIMSQYM